MKYYFIRHAPTNANLTGTMVKNYDEADIVLTKKPNDWEEKVGKYIPEKDRRYIFTSPAKRCLQTCKLLFNRDPNRTSDVLSEFDCSSLGDRKFWELSKKEFNELVPLSKTKMRNKIFKLLKVFNKGNAVFITHGMLIRFIYHYICHHTDIGAYEVINSIGFNFSNLDLLIIDTDTWSVEVHHYNEPVNHKI